MTKMKAYIVLCALFCLGVAEAQVEDQTDVVIDPVLDCKHNAYLQTVNCSDKIEMIGTVEVQCLTDVIVNYVECTKKAETTISSRFSDAGLTVDGAGSAGLIRCVVVNALDTIKCVVDSELSGALTWDWTKFAKCMYKFLPEFFKCTI